MQFTLVEIFNSSVRFTALSLLVLTGFGSNMAMAEFHSGVGSGYSRGYADGPGTGYGAGGVNPCSPTSAAANVANPSFNTPIVPGTTNPAAQPKTVASAPPPVSNAKPPENAPTESKPSASGATDKKPGGGAGPDPAPGKDDEGGGAQGGSELVKKGESLYTANCRECHAKPHGADASLKSMNHEAGAKKMPEGGEQLPEADRAAIVAYIKSLK